MKHIIRLSVIMFLAMCFSCTQGQESFLAFEDVISENLDQTDISENITIDERKIIKEGEIKFETANSQDTRIFISKTVAEIGGYMSEDNAFDYENRIEHRITIRVPADKFELLLENISQKAAKLDSKNITALDVTEQFIDVEARIKTKKELESRYKELLKKANKVDEILTIEKEIGKLRTEIESMEGRLKYLKDRVSFSTLTVVFYEKTTSSFGFSAKIGQALQNGWTILLWCLIILTNLWAFIAGGLIIFFIFILYRNRKRKRKAIAAK